MKILWRRSTETAIAFGERCSPRCRAPHGVHTTLRVHGVRGFLARCECERGYVRGCERTGFSPHAPTFCCTRLKSAKNLYLSHRFFCKIRQIHRFFCNFRQKLQILCRNQARGSWVKSRSKLEQSRRIYEPEMHTKSEQKYSDKARKTGKSLRHGEKIRQITQT